MSLPQETAFLKSSFLLSSTRSRLGAALLVSAAAIGCQPWSPAASNQQPLFSPPGLTGAPGTQSSPAFDPFGAAQPLDPNALAAPPPPSTIHVPIIDAAWSWEQLVDTVDDYFRIESEQPVQLIGDVLTEGRIDTFPQMGATVLEPHRPDSVGRYNRWESTFQTIRRRATLRIMPDANGYLIDAVVEKELEDLPWPERSTAGAATFRNDSALNTSRLDDVDPARLSGDWLSLGRDVELERALLTEIQMRITRAKPPGLFQQ